MIYPGAGFFLVLSAGDSLAAMRHALELVVDHEDELDPLEAARAAALFRHVAHKANEATRRLDRHTNQKGKAPWATTAPKTASP